METTQIIDLRHNQGWCERHINGRRFQSVVYPRSNQLLPAVCTNQATPIVSQCLGIPPVLHHNLSTVCDIALGGEVLEMARLKLAAN